MATSLKFISILLSLILIVNALSLSFVIYANSDADIIYGDANSDRDVNAKDVMVLRKHLAAWTVDIDLQASDVTADGLVNSKDTLLLRKFCANWDVVLGPEETTETDYTTKTYTMGQMSDNMNIVGRGVEGNDHVYLDFTASGIEFQADCKGDITLGLKWGDKDGTIGIVIDDDYDNMQVINVLYYQRKIQIAKDLIAGTHKFRIVKLNEFNIYSGGTYFRLDSITIDGTLKDKPLQNDLKIEFYGDSITCGYGNLCPSTKQLYPLQDYQHGYKTFAAFTAQELKAEFSVCAASGHGLYYSNTGSKDQILDKIWDVALPMNPTVSSELKVWDFSKFSADIVVINIGANDLTYTSGNAVTVTDEQVREAATSLINNIRSKNPGAYVIWIGGISGKYVNDYINIDGVLKTLDLEDDNFWYKGDMSRRQSGGNYHPNVEEHKLIADELVLFIKESLGDKISFD